MGKLLILIGLILVAVGVVINYFPNIPIGKLPGDIRIERESFSLYIPITTCLIISALIMLVIYVKNRIL